MLANLGRAGSFSSIRALCSSSNTFGRKGKHYPAPEKDLKRVKEATKKHKKLIQLQQREIDRVCEEQKVLTSKVNQKPKFPPFPASIGTDLAAIFNKLGAYFSDIASLARKNISTTEPLYQRVAKGIVIYVSLLAAATSAIALYFIHFVLVAKIYKMAERNLPPMYRKMLKQARSMIDL